MNLILPFWVDRKRYLGRPAGYGACWQEDYVSDRLVSPATTVEHPRTHRHVEVCIVVNADFTFPVMQSMQSTGILHNGPAPGDRKGQV
jgi:hypothetical protein